MKKMDSASAMKIVQYYSDHDDFTEDEAAEFIEALEYMLDHDLYTNAAWMFDLADLYDRIGKYELAVKYYEMCIADHSTIGYLGLGDTYRHMKEYDRAFACYRKAEEHGLHKAAGKIAELIAEMEEEHGTGQG